jgi:hypothetical protein
LQLFLKEKPPERTLLRGRGLSMLLFLSLELFSRTFLLFTEKKKVRKKKPIVPTS